jgi:nodulation protein E
MRRVVITGQGCVSALGNTARETWAAMCEGRPGIGPLTGLDDPTLKTPIAAQARAFRALDHFDEKRLVLLDPVSQMALVAAREAVAQAGVTFEGARGERTAVVIGTGIGGAQTQDQMAHRLYWSLACAARPSRWPAPAPRATTRSARH